MKNCIRMHSDDNVATVIAKTETGDRLSVLDTIMNVKGSIESKDAIPFAHKISLKPIEKDALIIKYGEKIGKATEDIAEGAYVHVHNVVSIEGSENVIRKHT